jgi:hypothetical protein
MGYLVGTPHFKICYKTPGRHTLIRNRIFAAVMQVLPQSRLTYDCDMHERRETRELKNQTCRPEMKWLQDRLQKGDIKIHHVPTSLNMADILKKALPQETFVSCIDTALNPDDIFPPITKRFRTLTTFL